MSYITPNGLVSVAPQLLTEKCMFAVGPDQIKVPFPTLHTVHTHTHAHKHTHTHTHTHAHTCTRTQHMIGQLYACTASIMTSTLPPATVAKYLVLRGFVKSVGFTEIATRTYLNC